jgi:hypothetical protein
MIERETVKTLLAEWGRWQRTAKNPSLTYAVSQMDTPLQKKRQARAIYCSEQAENIDKIMMRYLSKENIEILELTYVDKKANAVAANMMGYSVKTYTIKRNEVISLLQGIVTVIRDYDKSA